MASFLTLLSHSAIVVEQFRRSILHDASWSHTEEGQHRQEEIKKMRMPSHWGGDLEIVHFANRFAV